MTLPIVLVPHPHVRQDPNVLGGSPYVVGSRVPVRRLYGFFQRGTSVERILKRYPQLGAAKVLDALAFALDNPEVMEADLHREEELLAHAGHRPVRNPAAAGQIELPFASEAGDAPAPADRPATSGRGKSR
jgi:uncharacterized protein (DUF433 family)